MIDGTFTINNKKEEKMVLTIEELKALYYELKNMFEVITYKIDYSDNSWQYPYQKDWWSGPWTIPSAGNPSIPSTTDTAYNKK